MSSYDIEHNVPATNAASERRRQRPDLDSFYSSLNHIDTSQTRNANAVPIPADISASFRLLDEGMQALMESNPNQDLAEEIHVYLRDLIEAPPTKVKGLPAEFIDGLERVPKKILRKSDECPICGSPFLDDQYPLVVRLPCNDKHMFDLECIQPWFKLNSTCPLDRKDLAEKKKIPPPPPADEEQEDYDMMYA